MKIYGLKINWLTIEYFQYIPWNLWCPAYWEPIFPDGSRRDCVQTMLAPPVGHLLSWAYRYLLACSYRSGWIWCLVSPKTWHEMKIYNENKIMRNSLGIAKTAHKITHSGGLPFIKGELVFFGKFKFKTLKLSFQFLISQLTVNYFLIGLAKDPMKRTI